MIRIPKILLHGERVIILQKVRFNYQFQVNILCRCLCHCKFTTNKTYSAILSQVPKIAIIRPRTIKKEAYILCQVEKG